MLMQILFFFTTYEMKKTFCETHCSRHASDNSLSDGLQ